MHPAFARQPTIANAIALAQTRWYPADGQRTNGLLFAWIALAVGCRPHICLRTVSLLA